MRIGPFRCVALSLALLCAGAGAQSPPSGQAQQWMQEGSAALRDGRGAEAVELFRRATGALPSSPDAFLGLGLAELRTGNADDAREALTRALALDPKAPAAHLFLGIAKYQAGDPGAAGEVQQELAVHPDNLDALTWLGIIELAAGNAEAAAAPLDRAAVLSPRDGNVLYYRGRAHSLIAEETYQALYQLDPDSANVHRALGESLSASGQPEKAIAEFEAAIRKQPTDADLYESLGNEEQKISRFDDAARAYEQQLKLNPKNPVALYNLGKMRVERGAPEAGVALLRQAVAAHATAAPTFFYLGLGLAELGQNSEASTWLERSLASQPSEFIEESAYYQVARVYAKLGRKAEAQAALDKLKALKGGSASEGPGQKE